MTFVLSIVACAPEGPSGRGGLGAGAAAVSGGAAVGAQSGDDGNVGVERILARMERALAGGALAYQARLERAAYVRDVAILLARLRAERRDPDIVQLVGHGSPGRLQLGSYWSGATVDPVEGHAALTGNPESYGMLIERLPPGCRVFLLGCHVGAERRSGYVASGRALLYGLEVMSGAHVYGADGLVTPEDFGDGFLYDGSLVMSCGKPANPGAVARGRAARKSRDVRNADRAAS